MSDADPLFQCLARAHRHHEVLDVDVAAGTTDLHALVVPAATAKVWAVSVPGQMIDLTRPLDVSSAFPERVGLAVALPARFATGQAAGNMRFDAHLVLVSRWGMVPAASDGCGPAERALAAFVKDLGLSPFRGVGSDFGATFSG